MRLKVLHAEHGDGLLGVQVPGGEADDDREDHDGPTPVANEGMELLQDPEQALGHGAKEAVVDDLSEGLLKGQQGLVSLGSQVERAQGLGGLGYQEVACGIRGSGARQLPEGCKVVIALVLLILFEAGIQAQALGGGGQDLALGAQEAEERIVQHFGPGHGLHALVAEGEQAAQVLDGFLGGGVGNEQDGGAAGRGTLHLEHVAAGGDQVGQALARGVLEDHGGAPGTHFLLPDALKAGPPEGREAREGGGEELRAVLAPDHLLQRPGGHLPSEGQLVVGHGKGGGGIGHLGGASSGGSSRSHWCSGSGRSRRSLGLSGGSDLCLGHRRSLGVARGQPELAAQQDHAADDEVDDIPIVHGVSRVGSRRRASCNCVAMSWMRMPSTGGAVRLGRTQTTQGCP